MQNNIEKTLTISTGHVSNKTRILLNKMAPETLHEIRHDKEFDRNPIRFVQHHQYGWIIFTGSLESLQETDLKKMPDLRNIMEYAITQGCSMINLDRDASAIDNLKTYNW